MYSSHVTSDCPLLVKFSTLLLVFTRSYEAVEDVLEVSDLYDPRTQWASYIINGLKVHAHYAHT
jgi:hypothetical protein